MTSVEQERDDGSQCWCRIKFDSGERILISIAGKPTGSVKVVRLVLGGIIPVKTIWELTADKVGSNDAYIERFIKMFMPDQNELKRPLEAIRNAVLRCSSINEAKEMLLERERAVL